MSQRDYAVGLACVLTSSTSREDKAAASAALTQPHPLIQVGGGQDHRAGGAHRQADAAG